MRRRITFFFSLMVPKKSKSKRQPAALKYKILKKARKQKKDMPQKKLRKDLGVPNLFPFKQEFLKQMDQQREMTYKQLAESAVQRQLAAASVPAQVENQAVPQEESRKFYQQFHSIVEQADVVLMVLDARDPLGTSCQEIQQQIVQQGKRLVLVLNKIDLVPAQVLQKWLAHLRHTAPTLCFKASTQKQRVNLGRGVSVDSQESVGADKLIQTLKNYCRSDKIKTSITVGVVGYPNVGKSSLINSLKRAKVCNVGSTPGVTRKDQLIRLDSNIKLIDCPGIVFAKATNENQAQVMLRNCVRTELLKDPLIAIKFILEKCSVKILQDIYKIPFFVSMEDFLVQVARARGRLSKV